MEAGNLLNKFVHGAVMVACYCRAGEVFISKLYVQDQMYAVHCTYRHTGSSCATITTNSEMAVPNRGFTSLSPYLTFLEPPVVKGKVD